MQRFYASNWPWLFYCWKCNDCRWCHHGRAMLCLVFSSCQRRCQFHTDGNKVNIQDGAVLHCTYEKTKLHIGNNVSIGHNALVHGCTIEDNVLIGMGSIVMDNCHIETNSIVAAGAVLTEGSRVESWSIYAGIPAKKIKTLTPELFAGEVQRIANNYVLYSSWFK